MDGEAADESLARTELQPRLAHASSLIWMAASRRLGELAASQPWARDWLLECSRSPSALARSRSAPGLAVMAEGAPQALERLGELGRDADAAVRAQAGRAWGLVARVRSDRALEALTQQIGRAHV